MCCLQESVAVDKIKCVSSITAAADSQHSPWGSCGRRTALQHVGVSVPWFISEMPCIAVRSRSQTGRSWACPAGNSAKSVKLANVLTVRLLYLPLV